VNIARYDDYEEAVPFVNDEGFDERLGFFIDGISTFRKKCRL
jgi:hypothetical protein